LTVLMPQCDKIRNQVVMTWDD